MNEGEIADSKKDFTSFVIQQATFDKWQGQYNAKLNDHAKRIQCLTMLAVSDIHSAEKKDLKEVQDDQ